MPTKRAVINHNLSRTRPVTVRQWREPVCGPLSFAESTTRSHATITPSSWKIGRTLEREAIRARHGEGDDRAMSYQKVPESYPPPGKPLLSLLPLLQSLYQFRFLDLNSPARDPLLFVYYPSATDRVVTLMGFGINSLGNAAPDLLWVASGSPHYYWSDPRFFGCCFAGYSQPYPPPQAPPQGPYYPPPQQPPPGYQGYFNDGQQPYGYPPPQGGYYHHGHHHHNDHHHHHHGHHHHHHEDDDCCLGFLKGW